MEILAESPVKLSEGAVKELRRLLIEDPGATGKFLRVGVKGGGCSGMTYVLEFDDKKDADDVFDIDGITCVINPSHEMYLYGMEIHYDNGLNSRGFVFKNPNASSTCGCGTSFAV